MSLWVLRSILSVFAGFYLLSEVLARRLSKKSPNAIFNLWGPIAGLVAVATFVIIGIQTNTGGYVLDTMFAFVIIRDLWRRNREPSE